MLIARKYLNIALALLILLCLGFFLRATDWPAVLESVRKVGFRFTALLGISSLVYGAGTLGWRYCMPAAGIPVRGWQLFWIRHFGETIAMMNPTGTIGGEAVKIYLLGERGMAPRQALQACILARLLMLASQFFLLILVGIGFLRYIMPGFSGFSVYLNWKWVLLAMPVLAFVFWSLFSKNGLANRFPALRVPVKFRKIRQDALALWLDLGAFYRENKGAMALSFLFFCGYWLLGALELSVILLFLGVKITFFKALLVEMGVVLFKMAGAFIPGQLGVEEYGNKVMLAMIGVAGSTVWVAVSVLRRARQLCWIGVGLLVYVLWFRKRVG